MMQKTLKVLQKKASIIIVSHSNIDMLNQKFDAVIQLTVFFQLCIFIFTKKINAPEDAYKNFKLMREKCDLNVDFTIVEFLKNSFQKIIVFLNKL